MSMTIVLLVFVYFTPARSDWAYQYDEIQVELEIEDPLWSYKSEDPVLTCTVHSLTWMILWRRDDLFIGLRGRPVGDDRSQYNISTIIESGVRRERLCISGSIVNASLELHSSFRCENQGFSSPNVYLDITEGPVNITEHNTAIVTSTTNIYEHQSSTSSNASHIDVYEHQGKTSSNVSNVGASEAQSSTPNKASNVGASENQSSTPSNASNVGVSEHQSSSTSNASEVDALEDKGSASSISPRSLYITYVCIVLIVIVFCCVPIVIAISCYIQRSRNQAKTPKKERDSNTSEGEHMLPNS